MVKRVCVSTFAVMTILAPTIDTPSSTTKIAMVEHFTLNILYFTMIHYM